MQQISTKSSSGRKSSLRRRSKFQSTEKILLSNKPEGCVLVPLTLRDFDGDMKHFYGFLKLDEDQDPQILSVEDREGQQINIHLLHSLNKDHMIFNPMVMLHFYHTYK